MDCWRHKLLEILSWYYWKFIRICGITTNDPDKVRNYKFLKKIINFELILANCYTLLLIFESFYGLFLNVESGRCGSKNNCVFERGCLGEVDSYGEYSKMYGVCRKLYCSAFWRISIPHLLSMHVLHTIKDWNKMTENIGIANVNLQLITSWY